LARDTIQESYLTLLDAFEAVYQNRKKPASKHVWYYFGNLGGHPRTFGSPMMSRAEAPSSSEADCDSQGTAETVREMAKPCTVGGCFLTAIRDEGVESADSTKSLPPIGRLSGALPLGPLGAARSPAVRLASTARMIFRPNYSV